jgi:outer membrane lipoprotein-sorting protein
LYLWQIRHIPNDRQILLRLASVFALLAIVAVSLFPATTFVAGQSTSDPSAQVASPEGATPAEEFFGRVRQELQKHRSIKAEMAQVVSIGEQQFKIAGEYLSAGQKLKLQYTVEPNQGAQGEMLEICDGNELSTMLKIMDTVTVTQRNVQQILAAANASHPKAPETAINAELGMGGISTLLASLNRTMAFDAMRDEESGGQPLMVIQGRWKKEILAQFPKERDDVLPQFIPDFVQISIDRKTLFPAKIVYLKKVSQNTYLKTQQSPKSIKPLLSLEFRNVEFNGPVDDEAFKFFVPPGVIPVDVTRQYLDRFAAAPPAQPAATTP